MQTEFVNEIMDTITSQNSRKKAEIELKSYMEKEFEKVSRTTSTQTEIEDRIVKETLKQFPHLTENQEMKTYLSYLAKEYINERRANNTESFTNYLNQIKSLSNTTEEENDFIKVELKAVPIDLNFSRLYFGEIQDIPDHAILILRNPFITLVSMQMKKAALAAKDYGAYIFHTNAWNNFILNGLKAWYAHTRGWLCSNVTISVLHYEDLAEDYSQGNNV